MNTVLLSGVGGLGEWALEMLARAPAVDRIVTVKKTPWPGPSRPALAMIGSAIQGHTKQFAHYQVDLADTGAMADVLSEVRPDVILHSATVQSPRRLMNASLDPGRRAAIRSATFGMWLPWHLLPATQLFQAIERCGIDTKVVNTCFPDVVNPMLWKRYGYGPVAGAGNVEVCVGQILRYLVDVAGLPSEEVKISLVGSHALLVYGPDTIPYHLQVQVAGRDISDQSDLALMLNWPEPIRWNEVTVFSLFAASAVKNVLALLGSSPLRTHVTAPDGLPGGYPVWIDRSRIRLDLPVGLEQADAVAINQQAARQEGIERIEAGGSLVYTSQTVQAMSELGYDCPALTFDDLAHRSRQLTDLYHRLTA